jgi:hypothetical protein
LATCDSTPGCGPGGRDRFGKLGCATHVFELTAAQLLAQFRELVVLLVLSVIEDGVAKFRQLPGERQGSRPRRWAT